MQILNLCTTFAPRINKMYDKSSTFSFLLTSPIPVSSLGKVLDFKDFFCITEKVGADMSRIYSIERTYETQ